MSKYFQSDDIPTCDNTKDCFHTHYKIIVDNVIIKTGRYAVKQTKNIENRIIYSRKYNVSKKEYVNEWSLISKTKNYTYEQALEESLLKALKLI